MRMRRSDLRAALLATGIGLVAGLAFAHSGETGVVKERMVLMKAIGAAMKSLTETMRGERPYDAERVRKDAGEIARHGGEAMTSLFPQGSLDKPSEAKPEIWQDWDRFAALAGQLEQIAEALGQAADNPRGGAGTASMAGGMMGGGMTGGGMMSSGRSGGGMSGGGMMTAGQPFDPSRLADMPPEAAYKHLTQTCSACHEDFRIKR